LYRPALSIAEVLSEEPSSPVQARHDRAHRDARSFRGFAVRQVLEVDPGDRLAETDGQIGERTIGGRGQSTCARLGGGRGSRAWISVISFERASLPSRLAASRHEYRKENGVHPCTQTRIRVELVQETERALQGILHHVIRFAGVRGEFACACVQLG
jgi:hypothetical protein